MNKITIDEARKIFWELVDKNGPIPKDQPELGQCWVWLGSKRTHGHGHFNVLDVGTSAHQFSYYIHHGPIPKGLYVLHGCDCGWCVNPAHLTAGTQKENMQGAKERGRMPRGESSWASTFTEEQVAEIRMLYSEGTRIYDIAKRFGRVRTAITHVIHDRWQHSSASTAEKRNNGASHYRAKLTEADVRSIRHLRATTHRTLKDIAKQFGVNVSCCSSIINRHTWKNVD